MHNYILLHFLSFTFYFLFFVLPQISIFSRLTIANIMSSPNHIILSTSLSLSVSGDLSSTVLTVGLWKSVACAQGMDLEMFSNTEDLLLKVPR